LSRQQGHTSGGSLLIERVLEIVVLDLLHFLASWMMPCSLMDSTISQGRRVQVLARLIGIGRQFVEGDQVSRVIRTDPQKNIADYASPVFTKTIL
jgi:hypothetical protein